MQSTSQDNKRIIKNTLLLYFRMFILMGVSLYTSRVVLKILGVEDFGIYNVVGGVVTMFGLISNSLSAAISRYLNIEMGKGNKLQARIVFSTSVNIQIIFAIIVILIAELVVPWFIANKMTIPDNRLQAAYWVFHCSIIAFAINLISIPYNACIIAHEDMKIYAYISILEAILKLAIVYILLVFSIDKLALYAVLTLVVAIIIRIIYQLYCKKNYEESIHSWTLNKSMIKELFAFSSWNTIGNASVLLSSQGVNILMNIFCNPIVNAANGIATQVNGVITNFSRNFMTALNPQITKNYGAKDFNRFKMLMLNGSRYGMCLLIALSIPFLLETSYIMKIWLDQVPPYTCSFVQLVLLLSISESSTNTYTTGILATGNIKWVMILVAGIRLMNFPLSWVCFNKWGNPELTFIVSIFISQGAQTVRLCLLSRRVDISIRDYYMKCLIPQSLVLLVIYLIGEYTFKIKMEEGAVRFIVSIISLETIYLVLVYGFLLSKIERTTFKCFVKNKIYSYAKKNSN